MERFGNDLVISKLLDINICNQNIYTYIYLHFNISSFHEFSLIFKRLLIIPIFDQPREKRAIDKGDI